MDDRYHESVDERPEPATEPRKPMTISEIPVRWVAMALAAIVAIVLLVVIVNAARDDSEYTYHDEGGAVCPYLKVAADEGDYDAQQKYEEFC